MKIAIGQINATIGDFSGNCKKILQYTKNAVSKNIDLIVFPEMAICGYPPMDLLDYQRFALENSRWLRWLQQQLPRNITVVAGYVDKNRNFSGKSLQNSAAVIQNNKIIHTQAKTLLPTYDVFDEARYFEPAIDRSVFSLQGKTIGIAICEDIWWETEIRTNTRYPIDPLNDLLNKGAELIVVPSASPFYWGKQQIREKLLAYIGKSSGVPVVYANMIGGNDNLIFDGSSFITDQTGKIVSKGKSFEEDTLFLDNTIFSTNISSSNEINTKDINQWESILEALILGTRDYIKKCGFREAHIGISGGIDSALVAVIAVKALGSKNVHGFSLPSSYTSNLSMQDAEALCKNLNISLDIIPIDPIVKQTNAALKGFFSNYEEDITEENIQARIRGILLMAYSNKTGSFLLSTGNKSEISTGYSTLYGDMCGGLSIIGDLFKTQVYEMCRHINRKQEIIPNSILTKAPSAELKPNQTDQDTLPSYDVLDKILYFYLMENYSSEEIIEKHKEIEPQTIKRIIHLVGKSEYKRRQAPPVLKISPKAFDTGRRMPIARVLYE